ncbi:MAG: transglycosylase domain-containing protein [Gammaproteobacteria bacterium]|nr:transglycosylase domain-containing protein [Gammaproteobacteria bacterium]
MNPVIDWERLGVAVGQQALKSLGRQQKVIGASTLATQLEKFRHSPEASRAMRATSCCRWAPASLRVYSGGQYTLPARRQLLLDYLNALPLARTAGLRRGGEPRRRAGILVRQPLRGGQSRARGSGGAARRAGAVLLAGARADSRGAPPDPLPARPRGAGGASPTSHLRRMARDGVIPGDGSGGAGGAAGARARRLLAGGRLHAPEGV